MSWSVRLAIVGASRWWIWGRVWTWKMTLRSGWHIRCPRGSLRTSWRWMFSSVTPTLTMMLKAIANIWMMMWKIRGVSSSERQWGGRKWQRSIKIRLWCWTTCEEAKRRGDAVARINSMPRSSKRTKPRLTRLKLVTTSKNSRSLGSRNKRKSNSKK